MVIAPIIFCTVVHGIASMKDMKKVGRVGLKAIVYFEVVTTLALVVGPIVANLWSTGAGMNVDVSHDGRQRSIQQYTAKAHEQSAPRYVIHVIPATVIGAFAEGEILPVLFFALFFSRSPYSFLGRRPGSRFFGSSIWSSRPLFGVVAHHHAGRRRWRFGAMAFTIGKYGIGTLLSLGQLMASVYATCLIFIFVVLGGIARPCGFSIVKFIRYIKEELLIVLGTSSSKSVLPRMITKLENLGCQESVVGLVIPTGYSFNLDGTCIYLTMAALFLAQAANTELTLAHQLGIIGVLLLTSKGAAGVTGSGFIVLAATLAYRWDDPGGKHCLDSRCRPLYVRGPRPDQPDRKWSSQPWLWPSGKARSMRRACTLISTARRLTRRTNRRRCYPLQNRSCRRSQ